MSKKDVLILLRELIDDAWYPEPADDGRLSSRSVVDHDKLVENIKRELEKIEDVQTI